MNGPRYLCYNVDKHQPTPWFRNDVDEVTKADAESGLTGIVDLEYGLVLCNSKDWKPVDGFWVMP